MPTASSTLQYEVLSTPGSEQAELAHLLNHVTGKGGRVVSVSWVPARTSGGKDQGGGYVIVAEYPGAGTTTKR